MTPESYINNYINPERTTEGTLLNRNLLLACWVLQKLERIVRLRTLYALVGLDKSNVIDFIIDSVFVSQGFLDEEPDDEKIVLSNEFFSALQTAFDDPKNGFSINQPLPHFDGTAIGLQTEYSGYNLIIHLNRLSRTQPDNVELTRLTAQALRNAFPGLEYNVPFPVEYPEILLISGSGSWHFLLTTYAVLGAMDNDEINALVASLSGVRGRLLSEHGLADLKALVVAPAAEEKESDLERIFSFHNYIAFFWSVDVIRFFHNYSNEIKSKSAQKTASELLIHIFEQNKIDPIQSVELLKKNQ